MLALLTSTPPPGKPMGELAWRSTWSFVTAVRSVVMVESWVEVIFEIGDRLGQIGEGLVNCGEELTDVLL